MSRKDLAIKVDSLSKVYRLGLETDVHESLVATFVQMMKSPLSNYQKYKSLYSFDGLDFSNPSASKDESILWALRNVSFEVKPGEVVGIIGRNGAGKSTLLKILSKITPPSNGRVEIHGRVSSLLEVGTGFHPELTGRDNVYLNGTILGMRKKEIDQKFDEIIDFSGVEKFLDTPVKRYSSGMKVRLAFAVAAHLEPEILIIDEVLAVGDADFQTKCLNKMQDVGSEGRTVLFVSHNMPAVTRLCTRCIMLAPGNNQSSLLLDGPTPEIVASYMRGDHDTSAERSWDNLEQAPGAEVVRLKRVRVRNEGGDTIDMADIRKPIALEMTFEVIQDGYILLPQFKLGNDEGVRLFSTLDVDPAWRKKKRPKGTYVSTVWIPGNFLAEGSFFVNAVVITLEPKIKQFHERDIVGFQVIDSMDGDSARGDWAKEISGVVRPLLKWETSYS